jgi:hypothetical protein
LVGFLEVGVPYECGCSAIAPEIEPRRKRSSILGADEKASDIGSVLFPLTVGGITGNG